MWLLEGEWKIFLIRIKNEHDGTAHHTLAGWDLYKAEIFLQFIFNKILKLFNKDCGV